jgi:hypothetical protein
MYLIFSYLTYRKDNMNKETKKKTKEDEFNEVLDALESMCISTIKSVNPNLSDESARNILAKIGIRIAYGKEMLKDVFTKESKNE